MIVDLYLMIHLQYFTVHEKSREVKVIADHIMSYLINLYHTSNYFISYILIVAANTRVQNRSTFD